MDSSQAATALLTEHLQYTPLSLIDDIIDSVNNLIYQGVGSLEAGLYATPPERLGFKAAGTAVEEDSSQAKQEIEEGLHKLETLLNSTVDKNFDKFEIYVLRNILSVPSELTKWIKLGHYNGINHPLPPDTPTEESVHVLRQKLNASRNVNRALQREHQRNAAVLSQLRAMSGETARSATDLNFSFLSNTPAAQTFPDPAQHPLTTTTTFTLSQLPTLRTALIELRSKLVTLRESPLSVQTAQDERREERREYIEQRTRLHLERSGQSVSEEARTAGGKAVDPAELESLEKIATGLKPV